MSNVNVIPAPPPDDTPQPGSAPYGVTDLTEKLDWRPSGRGADMTLLAEQPAEAGRPQGCRAIQPTRCGIHHETAQGVCCCGGDWPGVMTCHPCRNPGHDGSDCADGAPPEGGYGSGRHCNCQHVAPAEGLVEAEGGAS